MKLIYIFLSLAATLNGFLSYKTDDSFQFNDKLADVDLLYETSVRYNLDLNDAINKIFKEVHTDLSKVFNAANSYSDETLQELMVHITYVHNNYTQFSDLVSKLTESSCKGDLSAALVAISNLAGYECALVFREYVTQSELYLIEFMKTYFKFDLASPVSKFYAIYGYKNLIVVDSDVILDELSQVSKNILEQFEVSLEGAEEVVDNLFTNYENSLKQFEENFNEFEIAFGTSISLFERSIVKCEKFDNYQVDFSHILPKFKFQQPNKMFF